MILVCVDCLVLIKSFVPLLAESVSGIWGVAMMQTVSVSSSKAMACPHSLWINRLTTGYSKWSKGACMPSVMTE